MREDKLVLGLAGAVLLAFILWPASPLATLILVIIIIGLIYLAGRFNGNW